MGCKQTPWEVRAVPRTGMTEGYDVELDKDAESVRIHGLTDKFPHKAPERRLPPLQSVPVHRISLSFGGPLDIRPQVHICWFDLTGTNEYVTAESVSGRLFRLVKRE